MKELENHVRNGLRNNIKIISLLGKKELREQFQNMYKSEMWEHENIYCVLGWYETELERILK